MSAAPPELAPSQPRAAVRWVQLRADLALLAVAAVWGGTFVMIKDALAHTGPYTFLALRFSLAALLMLPLLVAVRSSIRWGRDLLVAGGLLGITLFAGYAFQTVGLQFTTPARAAFVTGMSVVIVPILLAVVFRRAASRGVWIGVAAAVIGLALLSLGPEILAGGAIFSTATALGDFLVVGCAVAFAVQILLLGHYAPRLEIVSLTLIEVAVAAVLSGGLALLLERPSLAQVDPVLPAAAFTGVFATVAAFIVQGRAQRFTTPTHTALIFSTEPVFGAGFAYLLAGETLALPALAGCALILAGMVVAQLAE